MIALLISCSHSDHSAAQPASEPHAECPPDKVVGWGDSLTYSLTKLGDDPTWQQAKPTWLDTLGEDVGVPTENFGMPSQGSAEIATRQGGLKPQVILDGNEIPAGATQPINISAVTPTDGWTTYATAGTMKMHGTLAGVAGEFEHTMANGASTFAFVPDAAPQDAVTVPVNTAFVGDGGAYRDCFQIIWAGTNNSGEREAITRDVGSMVRSLRGSKRYLVVGTIPAVKNALSNMYGERFVDLRAWLISDGLQAAGIEPTPEDAEAIANGEVPPSLRVEGTAHLTPAGYTAIGHYLGTIVKSRL